MNNDLHYYEFEVWYDYINWMNGECTEYIQLNQNSMHKIVRIRDKTVASNFLTSL